MIYGWYVRAQDHKNSHKSEDKNFMGNMQMTCEFVLNYVIANGIFLSFAIA